MTVKLKDYGIRGGWSMGDCDGCGKHRSVTGGPVSEDESLYFCVVCIVKDIEAAEEEMRPHPNERCASCGLEVENYHYNCQGHQNCLPECPRCGGELKPLEGGE